MDSINSQGGERKRGGRSADSNGLQTISCIDDEGKLKYQTKETVHVIMPRGRKRNFSGYVPRPWIHNSSSEFEDDDGDGGGHGGGEEPQAQNVDGNKLF